VRKKLHIHVRNVIYDDPEDVECNMLQAIGREYLYEMAD